MKCIVKKGSVVFRKLAEARNRIDECKQAARDLVKEFGFEGHASYSRSLGTGIAGLKSKNGVPDGFKKIDHQFVFPKKLNANKILLERIAALPTMSSKDINSVLEYEPEWIGLTMCNGPGIIWGPEFHLLEFSDGTKYKPIAGVKEITSSKYHELKEQREAETKKPEAVA